MSKTFLEVFPTLKIDEETQHLLEKANVTKVSANHDRSHVRIYLSAERLIFKKKIWYLEKEIKKLAIDDKIDFDTAKVLISEYKKSRGGYNEK